MNNKTRLDQLLAQAANLPSTIATFSDHVASINTKMTELESEGLIYGTISFRRSRYAMIVYPMRDGVRENPTYLGVDKEKLAKAEDGIERAREYDRLKAELEKYGEKLFQAEQALRSLQFALHVTK